MENHLIHYLETYTFSEIIAQATIFTVLVVILHHFFEIFPCFHYQTVLITDAKVIYYIGTAIRANGDLPLKLRNLCVEERFTEFQNKKNTTTPQMILFRP